MEFIDALIEAERMLARSLRSDEFEMLARTAPRYQDALDALRSQPEPPADEELETAAYEGTGKEIRKL